MVTLKEYLEEQKIAMETYGIKFSNDIKESLENEWFGFLCDCLKSKGTISHDIFNSLNDSQKWYINKHYLIHGINIFS